jgi:phosphonate transport system permease protein
MTTNAELSSGPVTAARISWRRLLKLIIAIVVIAVFVHAWTDTHISISEFFSSFHNLVRLVGEMFPPNRGELDPSIHAAILTFDTALLATAAAFVIALILTPLAARNITPHRSVYEITRAVIGFLRSIPLLISGLLFLVVVGPTPFAGVLALTVETVGVLPKLYAEAIEEMDMGPVDALRVSGARRTQVFLHGVLPAVTPTFVGLVIYRMDSNVRSALVLSAFGAGGIGFLLYQSIELFQWQQVGTELIVMLVLVLLVERASIFIRSRIA